MKYLKRFESLDIENSTYKKGDIVKIVDSGEVGMIKVCGVLNTRYIYTIQKSQSKSDMNYYFDSNIVSATESEKDLYFSLKAANKYNL